MYLIKLCEFTDALMIKDGTGEGTGLDTQSAVQMADFYYRMSSRAL